MSETLDIPDQAPNIILSRRKHISSTREERVRMYKRATQEGAALVRCERHHVGRAIVGRGERELARTTHEKRIERDVVMIFFLKFTGGVHKAYRERERFGEIFKIHTRGPPPLWRA